MVDTLNVPIDVQEAAAGVSSEVFRKIGTVKVATQSEGLSFGPKGLREAYQLPSERIAAGWKPPQRESFRRLTPIQPDSFVENNQPAPIEFLVYSADASAPQA